jgi:hypothetical protein
MDLLTAAGEPKVVISTDGTATHVDEAVFNLFLPEGAQQGLRALTVQNVVGEIQLLVNMNVLSASQTVAGTDQRNFSVQSWGSTLPEMSATEPGVEAIVNNPLCETDCTVKSTVNLGVVAAAPVVEIASASGDVIVKGKTGASSDEQPVFNLAFEANAQVDLAALFIANVVGRVQAAYNINIAAATLNLVPQPDTPFSTPFENASGVIKQVNSGVQFRGTPLGFGNTAVVIDIQHVPN